MIVNIGMKNNDESNLFLRSLWGNVEKEFRKCAWFYSPYKNSENNIISLGNMDIGLSETIEVCVHYKKKGVLDKIEFKLIGDKEIEEETQKRLDKVVEKTYRTYKEPEAVYMKGFISSYYPVSKYSSDCFRIETYNENISEIVLSAKGFGENDINVVVLSKIEDILNVLSVMSNLPFYQENQKTDKKNSYKKNIEEGDKNYDEDYIDGYPVKDGKLILLNYGGKIIEEIINQDKYLDVFNKFLNASRHFHTGRKIDAQINDQYVMKEKIKTEGIIGRLFGRKEPKFELKIRDIKLHHARNMNDSLEESATVSYMSALEVLATIVYDSRAERCKECGQLKYSISQKVKNLLCKYFPEHLAKEIHRYYNSRSKYLHEGKKMTNAYVGISIPQLDPEDVTGAKRTRQIPLLNVREYTGYCMRKVAQEYVLRTLEDKNE